MRLWIVRFIALVFITLGPGAGWAATVSPLAAAGYSVLPAPQRVTLTGLEFHLDAAWRIQLDPGVAENHVAVEALKDGFETRQHLRLTGKDGPAITLTIQAGAVSVDAAQDRDQDILAKDAYRIDLTAQGIRITANADAGLFYGAETLVQLLTFRGGELRLPAGEIVDWPDLQLRAIYWDDAHHLEHPDVLKRAIRQAAFFKINGFVLKLDGHFQFKHAPAVVEPYAMTPRDYQELTDYGLRYHVQLIPYLDAPAHIAFILKHPEYAPLRAFADSNYELSTLNPESYTLLFGMFQDLIDANKGGQYFFLSTDETYYVGMADDPKYSESARAKELGSPGKLLAEFLSKAGGYLHDRGRKVQFWGEHPMKVADVAACPPYLINGETYSPEFDAACKARGIRSTLYLSLSGAERLFPDYAMTPPAQLLHARDAGNAKVDALIAVARSESTRRGADVMGSLVAGWADMGLHPETFWLGYAAISAAGWNPRDTDAAQASADFYRLFYGPSAQQMDRIYRLLSTQAQFYTDSWEPSHGDARKGIWGNSRGIFKPRRQASEQTLPLPRAPQADGLTADAAWQAANARRLELTEKNRADSDELIGLLHDNLPRVEFNRYNLEVLLSIAHLCRQNLDMLRGIERMNAAMAAAQKSAGANDHAQVVAELDKALDLAQAILTQRNDVLKDTTATWYKSWFPRVPEANGRKFLHDLDNVKDHLPDRTIGMEYLVYRELLLPFGKWVEEIQARRNDYAKSHQLTERADRFEWNGK